MLQFILNNEFDRAKSFIDKSSNKDLFKQDINGNTYLHLALKYNRTEISKLLISKMSLDSVNYKNIKGISASILAAKNQNDCVIHKIIAKHLKYVK